MKKHLAIVPRRTFYWIRTLCLTLVLSGGAALATRAASPVRLPLEVMGPDGYTVSAVFTLEEGATADALYLKAHRLAYRDALVNPERGAKGSVRLNDGPWIDLDNSTVTCYDKEADYGCLSGAYHTVRLTVPIEGAVVGDNTLRFRFNATDSLTSGYRILELNLLQGGAPQLPADAFVQDDPAQWQPPLNNPDDINQGQALWENAPLVDYPGGPQLQATCADCHAQDGRDLEYYAYSNWSIEERAKFHGLDSTQAQQIASYIRSLKDTKGVQRFGRPWNPPYQPGPGLDSQPVAAWAAGAGLEAVLENDADMLSYLYPEGTSQGNINQVIDIKKTVNVREMPVPLQLPDWNDWLPHVHPLDMWGDHFQNNEAAGSYELLRAYLVAGNATTGVADGSLLKQLNTFRDRTNYFIRFMNGPQPCRRFYGTPPQPTPAPDLIQNVSMAREGADCEDALLSMNQWSAVKHWEVMHEFALEDLTDEVYPYGEARGWPGRWRQVFEVAAHRSANNSEYFKYQTKAMGAVQSATWYHLQMVLNAGNRDPYTWFPQDWFYTPAYIANTAIFNEVEMGNMITLSQLKMYQNLDITGPDGAGQNLGPDGKAVNRGPGEDGWWLSFVIPWRFESVRHENYLKGVPWKDLDTYQTGLRAKVTNAFLRQFLAKMSTYAIDSLPREAKGDNPQSAYNDVDTKPLPFEDQADQYSYYGFADNQHATAIYRTFPRFIEIGVDPALLGEYAAWCQAVWPQGNWQALIANLPSPSQLTLRAKGDCGGEVMELRLDGQTVQQWSVDTAYADYTYSGFTQGDVSVHFTNDRFQDGQPCEDNNLTVDYLEVCGRRYPTEGLATKSTDCCPWDPTKLYNEGSFRFGTLSCTQSEIEDESGMVTTANGSHTLRAYPNPASDQLTVVGSQNYQMQLYDLTGRPVMRHQGLRGRVTLDISHLRPGVYLLTGQSAGHASLQQRLIVK